MKSEQKFLVPRWRKAPNPKSVGNTELFQAQKTETRKYGTRMFHQVSLKLGLGKTFPKSACVCVHVCARVLSRSVTSDSETPWTVARQAPLSMGLFRQEY